MDVRLGDILVMKKEHPCGDKRWLVLRTGMDFRLRCLGCGHEVMLPRAKAKNNSRQFGRAQTTTKGCAKNQAKPHHRAVELPFVFATAFLRGGDYTLSRTSGKGSGACGFVQTRFLRSTRRLIRGFLHAARGCAGRSFSGGG